MRKCPENKSSSTKEKTKVCSKCCKKSSCHAQSSRNPLKQTTSDISSKISNTSFTNKGNKTQDKQCGCSKKPKNLSILNMITESKVCMCQVFARAFHSDIHMHMGTYIHQDETESTSTEDVTDYD